MTLTNDDLKKIKGLLNDTRDELTGKIEATRNELTGKIEDSRNAIMLDMRTLLMPIKEDLEWVKERLKKLQGTETENVGAAFENLNLFDRKVKEPEKRIKILELSHH